MPTDAQRRNLFSAHHAEVRSLTERIAELESVLRLAKDALECATLHHGMTSLPKKIEHFGSVDAAHDFGRSTWRDNVPGAIAAIDAAITSTQEAL